MLGAMLLETDAASVALGNGDPDALLLASAENVVAGLELTTPRAVTPGVGEPVCVVSNDVDAVRHAVMLALAHVEAAEEGVVRAVAVARGDNDSLAVALSTGDAVAHTDKVVLPVIELVKHRDGLLLLDTGPVATAVTVNAAAAEPLGDAVEDSDARDDNVAVLHKDEVTQPLRVAVAHGDAPPLSDGVPLLLAQPLAAATEETLGDMDALLELEKVADIVPHALRFGEALCVAVTDSDATLELENVPDPHTVKVTL